MGRGLSTDGKRLLQFLAESDSPLEQSRLIALFAVQVGRNIPSSNMTRLCHSLRGRGLIKMAPWGACLLVGREYEESDSYPTFLDQYSTEKQPHIDYYTYKDSQNSENRVTFGEFEELVMDVINNAPDWARVKGHPNTFKARYLGSFLADAADRLIKGKVGQGARFSRYGDMSSYWRKLAKKWKAEGKMTSKKMSEARSWSSPYYSKPWVYCFHLDN